jgi:hypothetical protein
MISHQQIAMAAPAYFFVVSGAALKYPALLA